MRTKNIWFQKYKILKSGNFGTGSVFRKKSQCRKKLVTAIVSYFSEEHQLNTASQFINTHFQDIEKIHQALYFRSLLLKIKPVTSSTYP